MVCGQGPDSCTIYFTVGKQKYWREEICNLKLYKQRVGSHIRLHSGLIPVILRSLKKIF